MSEYIAAESGYSAVVGRRSLLAIAVLPLIVLVGLRSAWAAYACTMDGKVRTACCCPKKTETQQAPHDGVPRIAAADCCDVTIGEASVPPDAREADRISTPDASPIAIASAMVAPPLEHVSLTVTRTTFARPPPRATPTYLANRTILR